MSTALLHSVNAGELLAAEIHISPKMLEDVLETLASAPFPVNPELDHTAGGLSRIRFPIYESQLAAVQDLLAGAGLSPALLSTQLMADELAADYEASL